MVPFYVQAVQIPQQNSIKLAKCLVALSYINVPRTPVQVLSQSIVPQALSLDPEPIPLEIETMTLHPGETSY